MRPRSTKSKQATEAIRSSFRNAGQPGVGNKVTFEETGQNGVYNLILHTSNGKKKFKLPAIPSTPTNDNSDLELVASLDDLSDWKSGTEIPSQSNYQQLMPNIWDVYVLRDNVYQSHIRPRIYMRVEANKIAYLRQAYWYPQAFTPDNDDDDGGDDSPPTPTANNLWLTISSTGVAGNLADEYYEIGVSRLVYAKAAYSNVPASGFDGNEPIARFKRLGESDLNKDIDQPDSNGNADILSTGLNINTVTDPDGYIDVHFIRNSASVDGVFLTEPQILEKAIYLRTPSIYGYVLPDNTAAYTITTEGAGANPGATKTTIEHNGGAAYIAVMSNKTITIPDPYSAFLFFAYPTAVYTNPNVIYSIVIGTNPANQIGAFDISTVSHTNSSGGIMDYTVYTQRNLSDPGEHTVILGY